MEEDKCGTTAGAARHRRAGEPDFDPRREAHRAQQQEWRKRNPRSPRAITAAKTASIREKALRRLGRLHEHELVEIMKQIREEEKDQ